MRRAVLADFATLENVNVTTTLDDRFPEENGPWTTVRVSLHEEPEVFGRLAAESDRTLCIAPETAGILLDRAQTIERVGGRSLGCTPAAIALTSNKAKTAEHLARGGISVPLSRCIDPRAGLPRDFPYPAVLKPIDGAGSVDTFFVASIRDLPRDVALNDQMLLQSFVAGVPMSVSFLVTEAGEVAALGDARQAITVADARFSYQGGIAGRLLEEIATPQKAVEAIPGLHGWVGVDLIWNAAARLATILEINPRLTTSYIGLRRLFPPGTLARAMLDGSSKMYRDSLAHERTVTFQANGICE